MILIAIGSNLPHPQHGGPRGVCEAALARLSELGLGVRRRSRWYRSAPVPASDQPWFVNGVAEVAPSGGLAPARLLELLHRVEAEFGRVRGARNAARILDLDLLDFDGTVSAAGSTPQLPHPRLHERAFVLLPLCDLVPDWRHPVLARRADELAAALPPDDSVEALD